MTDWLWLRHCAQDLFNRTVRDAFGNRVVVRDVQGVRLKPWSHRFPDYARFFLTCGQNLVDLAVGLGELDELSGVVDVG
jgi:hypothetical protein